MEGTNGAADSRSVRDSYRRLAAAQKSSVGVSLYSRWVNRPWGRLLASLAYQWRLTPNGVTAISAICSLAGVAVVATVAPQGWSGVVAGLLLMLGFAFDSADGQLARLMGGGSVRGEWLDHLVDAGKNVLVHSSVLLAAWSFYSIPEWWLLVPLGYLFVSVVQFTGILLTQFLERTVDAGKKAQRAPSLLRSVALLPADYGILAASFLFSGVPQLFVPLYSLLGLLTALITAGLIAGWWRRLA